MNLDSHAILLKSGSLYCMGVHFLQGAHRKRTPIEYRLKIMDMQSYCLQYSYFGESRFYGEYFISQFNRIFNPIEFCFPVSAIYQGSPYSPKEFGPPGLYSMGSIFHPTPASGIGRLSTGTLTVQPICIVSMIESKMHRRESS